MPSPMWTGSSKNSASRLLCPAIPRCRPRISQAIPILPSPNRRMLSMLMPPRRRTDTRGPYAPSRERARFSSEFISALLRDFRQGGPAAIAKVRKYQPAAYMKICALLVPREMKVEHSGAIKAMTDGQLEEAIEVLQTMIEAKISSDEAKVIDGTVETVALPAPVLVDKPKRPDKVMEAADTAVGRRSSTRGSNVEERRRHARHIGACNGDQSVPARPFRPRGR